MVVRKRTNTHHTGVVRDSLETMRAAYSSIAKEADELWAKWSEINKQVRAYEEFFRAFGQAPPPRVEQQSQESGKKRGEIENYMDQILNDGPKKVREIQESIEQQFGVKYAESSLYRVLMLKKDKYENANRKWNLRKGG